MKFHTKSTKKELYDLCVEKNITPNEEYKHLTKQKLSTLLYLHRFRDDLDDYMTEKFADELLELSEIEEKNKKNTEEKTE